MKILVVGALGDIGSEITRQALADGHSIVALDTIPLDQVTTVDVDHENLTYIKGNALEFEQLLDIMKETVPDGVITLAAVRTPEDYLVKAHNINVVITWNVLRAAAEAGIKRVAQASSINVVGAIFNVKAEVDYLPMDEGHPCRPDEPYGVSKQVMELQAEAICRRFPDMRVASMRPHWVLPATSFHRLIAMDELDSAKQLWGWTEVGACARAFLLAITSDSDAWKNGHEAFFIVSPRIGSHSPTAELVEEWWPKVPCRKEFHGHEGLFDCSKAKRILGWSHDLLN